MNQHQDPSHLSRALKRQQAMQLAGASRISAKIKIAGITAALMVVTIIRAGGSGRFRLRRLRQMRLRLPDALTLLVVSTLLAAAVTYILPAGQYERRDDPQTSRKVVVAGTYHSVSSRPVNPFQAFVAIPKGMSDAASVIFLVFLAGGAFSTVDRTGTLEHGVNWLVQRLERSGALAILFSCVAFGLGGILDGMQEEIIALVPVLLILTGRLGFDPLTAVAMSLGAAIVGAAFSPINPFQVGIAQKLAELPALSGSLFRVIFLILALGIWIWGTMRYATRTRTQPQGSGLAQSRSFGIRHGAILLLVPVTFAAYVFGVLRFNWDFDQMSGLFLAMGMAAGLLGGLGVSGTAAAFTEGFKSMANAALLIGFARAIFIVLEQGQVIDTIIHGLVFPLAHQPAALSALGMMGVHTLVHVGVPSTSGQAVLTLPVMVPLSDLLGLSRQNTVLAYQYGAGLCELITPTNGAVMAVLAAAGVRFEQWLRFVGPIYLALAALGGLAIVTAVNIGLK